MQPPTFHHERELTARGHLVIGVDEAGCGCLAGPVVAAAVHLPLDSRLGLIRDSKLLSSSQREKILNEFAARGYQWTIGVASVEEIDRLNIRQATYLAMRRAIDEFTNGHEFTKAQIIRDIGVHSCIRGRRIFALVDAWTIPNLPIPQRAIIHGDRLVKSIAAASIAAKVWRDNLMGKLDQQFPQYDLAKHKGYATAKHLCALEQHGLSPIHRATFCTGPEKQMADDQ